MRRHKTALSAEALLHYLAGSLVPCCGLDILATLIYHQDTPIHCTRLRHLNSPASIHAAEFDVVEAALPGYINTNHSIPELPIPALDDKALQQIKQQWLKLRTKEAEAVQDNDLALADDCREEREKLEAYLHKAISRKGKIRYLQNQAHDDYRVIRNNLLYMLNKVRTLNPAYAQYIEDHLVMGYNFVWRG